MELGGKQTCHLLSLLALLGCVDSIRDIAHGGKTQQSSTHGPGVSSRAVDGDARAKWEDKSCTHTKRENNPWWKVEVGDNRDVPVHSVMLTNRAGQGPRLRNFKVLAVKSSGAETLCYYFHGIFPEGKSRNLKCRPGTSATYIKVQIIGNGILTLCEVSVFGSDPGCHGVYYSNKNHYTGNIDVTRRGYKCKKGSKCQWRPNEKPERLKEHLWCHLDWNWDWVWEDLCPVPGCYDDYEFKWRHWTSWSNCRTLCRSHKPTNSVRVRNCQAPRYNGTPCPSAKQTQTRACPISNCHPIVEIKGPNKRPFVGEDVTWKCKFTLRNGLPLSKITWSTVTTFGGKKNELVRFEGGQVILSDYAKKRFPVGRIEAVLQPHLHSRLSGEASLVMYNVSYKLHETYLHCNASDAKLQTGRGFWSHNSNIMNVGKWPTPPTLDVPTGPGGYIGPKGRNWEVSCSGRAGEKLTLKRVDPKLGEMDIDRIYRDYSSSNYKYFVLIADGAYENNVIRCNSTNYERYRQFSVESVPLTLKLPPRHGTSKFGYRRAEREENSASISTPAKIVLLVGSLTLLFLISTAV